MRILHLIRQLLLVHLLVVHASPAQRELLADRAWWISRQLAPTPNPRSAVPAARDDFAVVEQLVSGTTVAGYELVERTALLGVCSMPSVATDSVAVERSARETVSTDGTLKLAGPSPALGAHDGTDGDDENESASEAVCALPLPERPSDAGAQVAQTSGGDKRLADGPTLEYQVRPRRRVLV